MSSEAEVMQEEISPKTMKVLPEEATDGDGDDTASEHKQDDVIPIEETTEEGGGVAEEEMPAAPNSGTPVFGRRLQGPLLAKFSSWGKQANVNAKDFLSRQRPTWKPTTPVGGILASAMSAASTATTTTAAPMDAATLEEPSPPKASQQTAVARDVPSTSTSQGGEVMEISSISTPPKEAPPPPPPQSSPLLSSPPPPAPTAAEMETPPSFRRRTSTDSLDDDESSEVSSYFSSTYSSNYTGEDASIRTSFRWAASSVVDSMQTYRGRYNNQGSSGTPLSTPIPLVKTASTASTTSQTQRILQSRAGDHLSQLMEGLGSHEYIMLLGHGFLGVNLKATFLQNRGVYVDYLVPNGAAATSHIIQPGDALLRVGDTDVQRSTIYKVPKQIAAASRPVHLIFCTGLPPTHLYEIGHVDVAIALLHQWQEDRRHKEEVTPSRSNFRRMRGEETPPRSPLSSNAASDDGETSEEDAVLAADEEEETEEQVVALVHPTSFDSYDAEPRVGIAELPSIAEVLDAKEEGFFLPPPIPTVREACREDVARRCSDLRVNSGDVRAEATTLERGLQFALLEVIVDYRKRPFYERHIKTLKSTDADHFPPAALLVLLLELWEFGQFYTLMGENQRATAVHRIAHTYFVPTTDRQLGTLIPPLLDFHSIVGDSSLRQLEHVLKHQQPLTPVVWRDFLEAAIEGLARESFLEFIRSDECACMRGHLRHTAPFWNAPLPTVVQLLCDPQGEHGVHAQNFSVYLLAYLLCQTDNDGIGELVDPDSSENPRTRIEEAASGFCAAVFIKGAWLTAIRSGDTETILTRYQQLWDTYLSPSVGSLAMTSLSNQSSLSLTAVLEALQKVRQHADASESSQVVPLLVDDVVVNRVHELGNALLYDYARNSHPKFMVHKFHEWMCQEAAKLLSDSHLEGLHPIPRLPAGCIKRFLRKVEFPVGVSSHKPTQALLEQEAVPVLAADCAIVFGNSVGLDLGSLDMDESEDLRRYSCCSLLDDSSACDNPLLPEHIPPTLEAYATVPISKKRPLSDFVNSRWISRDGWEISLVNFMVPRADASGDGDGSLYGVSLVFQRLLTALTADETKLAEDIPTELVSEVTIGGTSPLSFHTEGGSLLRRIKVGCDNVAEFNSCLQERTWRQRISREVRANRSVAIVGVALVSQSNVILSMRETLSNVLMEFSGQPEGGTSPFLVCGSLVDVLGNFAHQDVDADVLPALLRSFLDRSALQWVDRPLRTQQLDFEKMAGEQMVNSLPPIAISMMFVTALLEQKMVITSTRRSLLLSTTTALKQLLLPLKWCHLLVPRVPANMAGDLLQYPAPFILGLPSDEPGIMELIRELPQDVTLVDLDVGRVILASSFEHASELGRSTSGASDVSTALRSQILYLSQSLGTVFGACIDAPLWSCDRPLLSCDKQPALIEKPFDRLKKACREFIEELLAGTSSCCYWIEEQFDTSEDSRRRPDPTVLFDEDHFFHLKNKRSQEPYDPLVGPKTSSRNLSLPLEDFDLIFDVFLRCQATSHYIGTRDKSEMVFST